MNLYLLENIDPDWDTLEAIVVRAESEMLARKVANYYSAFEGEIWEDEFLTTCKIVEVAGESGAVLASYKWS